ncbi:MAG TPA: type I-U CRISPR-associated protein Csb2 [Acidimicrobiales bacterium]|jgi:CRISPR-associated protein Csb2|nr:type I-U CRISPR-associated protein Csb2 [Acidimicrobiales bacterium]
MALAVDIELLSGRYDAAGAADRESTEWPPHPARVFCAFVAGARSADDHEALRWLERLGPPVVWASPAAVSTVRRSYVVTNRVEPKGGSQFHLARSNALRRRTACLPESTSVRLSWLGAKVDASTIDRLDGIARRVPYLGRSTGIATVRCRAMDGDERPEPGVVPFTPAPDGRGPHLLRVPYPGYLDELVIQHEADRPAWEVSRAVTYRLDGAEASSVTHPKTEPSVYTDVIVLSFAGVRPDGRLAPQFTQALRRAVMSSTADPLPDALHGHGTPGRPHVAFLALPDAGHPHADGHLLGMAVAVPDLPADERRAIVRGVLAPSGRSADIRPSMARTFPLDVPGIGRVDLEHRPGLVRPWGVRPERWRQGSTQWVSVTPVVLDRFPKRGDAASEVARCCVALGLPEPQRVQVSTAPLTVGGIRLRPRDLPDHLRGKLFRHVELAFDRPVAGPVMLGAGRYLGIGLLAPDRPEGEVRP